MHVAILTIGSRGDVQPYVALGVGPQPIPRKRLSVERLAQAITTAVSDGDMQRRAAVLGRRIRSENGAQRAVEIITGTGG
jgi:sterol 3beta-glucosyltransferase